MLLSSFRKLQGLPKDERRLLVQALVWLPLTLLGVQMLGIGRWQGLLTKLAPSSKVPSPNLNADHSANGREPAPPGEQAIRQQVRTIARIMRIAAERGFYRPNCLQRSLVLWWLLRRHHIESEIRFGARKENGELKAHAWVECFGFAVNEDRDVCRHYSPFGSVSDAAPGEDRQMPA